MSDLNNVQLILIGLIFIWSGFVRSGLGFGGAVLSLPFLLLVHNDPLLFLPIIAVHLVFFSIWITLSSVKNKKKTKHNNSISPDWKYLKKAISIMIIPKLLGVFGLITFPAKIMSSFVFTIVLIYSLGFIFNKPLKSKNKWIESIMLALGGYVSGASLTGAPLIIPIFATNVRKNQLRSTLFALWLFLVILKLISFIIFNVDLQLIHHLWLFPCAVVGHYFGNKLHKYFLKKEDNTFFRILGLTLLFVSLIGLLNQYLIF